MSHTTLFSNILSFFVISEVRWIGQREKSFGECTMFYSGRSFAEKGVSIEKNLNIINKVDCVGNKALGKLQIIIKNSLRLYNKIPFAVT